MAIDSVQLRPKWLSDALVIAGVPAPIYSLTLAFHCAFAAEFEIPLQLISVTWTDAFTLGILLFGITFALFMVALLVCSVLFRDKHHPGYARAISALPWTAILIGSVSLFWVDWHRTHTGWFVVVMAISFISGWITNREHEAHQARDPQEARHWQAAAVVVSWLFSGILVSVVGGTLTARYEREFYVTRASPETVVLGIWANTVVAAPFDRKTGTVSREFIITKISDRYPLDVRLEKVGPLHTDGPFSSWRFP